MNNYVIPNLVKACEIMKILVDRPEGIFAAEVEKPGKIHHTDATMSSYIFSTWGTP